MAQEAVPQPVAEAKVDLLSKYAHLLPTRDADWRQKLAYVAPQPEVPEVPEHKPEEQSSAEEATVKLQSSPLKPLRQLVEAEASPIEVSPDLHRLPLRILTRSAVQEPATPIVKLALNEIIATAPAGSTISPGKQEKMPGKHRSVPEPPTAVVDPVDAKFEAQWSQMGKAAQTWQAISAPEGTNDGFHTEQAFRTAKVQLQLLASVSEASLEKGADAAELSAAMVRVKFAAHSLDREVAQLEQAYGACERDKSVLQEEVARAHGTEAKLREELAVLKAQLGGVRSAFG